MIQDQHQKPSDNAGQNAIPVDVDWVPSFEKLA